MEQMAYFWLIKRGRGSWTGPLPLFMSGTHPSPPPTPAPPPPISHSSELPPPSEPLTLDGVLTEHVVEFGDRDGEVSELGHGEQASRVDAGGHHVQVGDLLRVRRVSGPARPDEQSADTQSLSINTHTHTLT